MKGMLALTIPGLSALKRRTMCPSGLKTKVSLRIGIAGYMVWLEFDESKTPASSSDRAIAWKLWP
jgi:hypothetical protein